MIQKVPTVNKRDKWSSLSPGERAGVRGKEPSANPGLLSRAASAVIMVIGPLLLTGCSPTPDAHEATLNSRFFSRVQIIGTRGTAAGQFNKPRSVAVDRNDNLYVVDMTGRVQKFAPDGHYLLSWQMTQTDLGKPKGMGLDKDGNLIVIEPHYQRVNHFTPEGQLVAQWGSHGTNAGQFSMPRSVAVNSQGELYVSEYTLTERVQAFLTQRQKAVAELWPSRGRRRRVQPRRRIGHWSG